MIEWLIIGAAGVAALGWYRAVGSESGRAQWRAAGHALGLQHVQVRGSTWFLEGQVDGWHVRAEGYLVDKTYKTRLIVRPGDGGRISGQLAFAAEPKAIGRLFAGADRTVGEPVFDGAVRIGQAPWPLTLAMLGASNRKRLIACVADGVVVEAGELIAETDGPGYIADDIEARLRRMLRLAKGLDLSVDDVPVRLARNARKDPVAVIRRENLEALLAHYADHPLTDAAVQRALEDPNAEVRFEAAMHRPSQARPVLAGIVDDRAALGALRGLALAHLVDGAPGEWTDALLINHAGPEAPPELRAVVAQHAARRGLEPALLSVLHDPEGVPDDALAQAARAAAGLGALVEPSLLALVERGEGAARIAAVETLGQIGGPAAAALLRPLTRGITLTSDLKAAAQAAIEKLSARLATSPGALSLASTQRAGSLALTEGQAGHRAPPVEEG